MRRIAKFSEDFLTLEQLKVPSPRVRNALSRCFWGYHLVVLGLLLLEGPLGVSSLGLAKPAGYLLLPFWAVYAFNFVAIYLPSNGVYSLYIYLRTKNISPSHSILISLFTVIGAVSIFLYVAR